MGDFKDHTSGNCTGRMMVVNASYDKGEFSRRRFTGLLPVTSYCFSAWAMNISDTVIKPNVRFEVNDPAQSTLDLVLVNNNIGGEGNDLALDDIRFSLANPTIPVATQIQGQVSKLKQDKAFF